MRSEEIDKISSLPDDLLLKILSSISINKVVDTSLLSKRWRFLWRYQTKLYYDEEEQWSCSPSKLCLLRSFGVIQNFHLKISRYIKLDLYINLLARLNVREARIDSVYSSYTLPRSLIRKFWTLEKLTLEKLCLVYVPSSQDSFQLRFLKTLHLLSVRFSDDESVEKLLSTCPVLEDLVVRRSKYVNVMMYTINVPTLRSLSIDYSATGMVSQPVGVHGFVINAPSLRYLKIRDYFSNTLQFGAMPKLVKANVDVAFDQSDKVLGSFTSVQHLSLCSKTSKIMYPTGSLFFSSLEHVELCTCSPVWWNLLNSILESAPRLQVLKLKLRHCVRYDVDQIDWWNQPFSVPECLLSHLEIFEWKHYKGTKQEKKVAEYILANATCLKMATFSRSYVPRGSEACQLVFE